jgi:hypothetical protein
MAVRFHFASTFEKARSVIEQHLFDSIMDLENDVDRAIESVSNFSKAIDRLAETLEQMHQTPRPQDADGEKSFPIRDGMFRVFYKMVIRNDSEFDIYFIDVDHNKQSNLDRFPEHQLITFVDDE